ncbi:MULTISPECIES: putative quinol monooxygenase [Bacillus]|uniref:ABM domain-containing protein n=5 Tax=Bacillus TaxID=1386 RepID=A0A9W5PBZ3_9BACI|nr:MULTISPECIES: putative quinol monooxygenase [Bacillus]MDZ5722329.1 putative quinol monooxygenase [Bacillus sp. SXabc123]OLQ46787.1 monooxygenase [Bacillus licheniformis]CUB22707.1 Putative monooxygenase YcnE [Bacillus cereus]AEP85310.1 YcnE [Bacillus spizizenii TU-B-10]AMA51105.1 monooxygenase [Bacillus inaquosorum]
MIVLQAYIKVKPEKREEFLSEAQSLVQHSRAEEGNAQYDLFEKVGEENTFVMLEQWKDEAAMKFHNETAHFQGFVAKGKELLSAPLDVVRTELSE